jgi:hypothetical protein
MIVRLSSCETLGIRHLSYSSFHVPFRIIIPRIFCNLAMLFILCCLVTLSFKLFEHAYPTYCTCQSYHPNPRSSLGVLDIDYRNYRKRGESYQFSNDEQISICAVSSLLASRHPHAGEQKRTPSAEAANMTSSLASVVYAIES